MVILVDLDGCVCQYNFPKIIKKHFGVVVSAQMIHCHSIEDALGVSRASVEKMFNEEVHEPPRLIRGAQDALASLVLADHDVGIYTNRLYFVTQEELERWLYENGIPYTSIITGKTLPNYVHAHIDDSPGKLMDVQEATTVKHSLLFNQPWNKQCKNVTGELQRVRGWAEIRELIK